VRGNLPIAEPELWYIATFFSERARGNLTAVLLSRGEIAVRPCQQIAAWLGVPDTIFLSDSETPGEWVSRTFSPSEELAFCAQGLLAAEAALNYDAVTAHERCRIRTLTGTYEIARLPPIGPNIGWVRMDAGQCTVADMPSGSSLRSLLGRDVQTLRPEAMVDSGRKRLFVQLCSERDLDAVAPAAASVQAFCGRHGLSGVCPFVLIRPGTVALRVFTTSLAGGEDRSTGGAAAGVIHYLRALGASDTSGQMQWRVDQGSGPPHQRGTMFVLEQPRERTIYVGGYTHVISCGTFLGLPHAGRAAT